MSQSTDSDHVLEQNVSNLIETGGEPPRIDPAARTRIRAELVQRQGAPAAARTRLRSPLLAIGIGLVATAAAAVVVTRLTGDGSPGSGGTGATPVAGTAAEQALPDGSTWITGPGGKLTVIGPRHVRVVGPVLLDVATAPQATRFTVETARGTVHVLGTRFLVDGAPERTTAAVVRGTVKLASADGEVTLHAGEQGVAEPGRPPSRGPAPRLSSLVSWAAQARKRDEHAVQVVRNGTLFARDPNNPGIPESPLPIAKLTVDIVVENQVARVALDQTFHNPANGVREGLYKFAIPPDSSLQRLAMYVNGELMESAVVERMAARRIYEDIVYRRLDPALLEWAGTGRLNLRVYPLNPNEDKRLVLAYTQSLPKLYDDYTLTVPLPEVDLPVGELGFAVRMPGCANCEVTSPSHPVTVTREGDEARVAYSQRGAKLGDSLVLHVRDTRRTATVAMHQASGDAYVMVRARPTLPVAQRAYQSRTWVILDDVSASRGRLELRAQADLVDGFLQELDEDDRVAVVAFDTAARVVQPLTRVNEVERRTVRTALTAEGGVGATDVAAALAKATELLAGVVPEDAMVVYLGDGVVTAGPRELEALRTLLRGKARFIGVGVGDGPDTQTLAALAAATDGYATTIDLADDLGWRAFDLVAALHTTRVVGLAGSLLDPSGTTVPGTLYLGRSQLADGEELELVGKFAAGAKPTTALLTGTVDGEPWEQRVELGSAGGLDGGYLPRLWAQRHVAARLLAKHAPIAVPACDATRQCTTEAQLREQRNEKIRQEVVTLGKQYFLLSRHTSLLVLENDAMYTQYGVTKGAGDTWAPYALPPKLPVVVQNVPAGVPASAHVATDAALVRTPLPLFYDGVDMSGLIDSAQVSGWASNRGSLRAQAESKPSRDESGSMPPPPVALAKSDSTSLGDASGQAASEAPPASAASRADRGRDRDRSDEWAREAAESRLANITTGDSRQQMANGFGGRLSRQRGQPLAYGGLYAEGSLTAIRLTNSADAMFDDLTELVPGLAADTSDVIRADLVAHGGARAHSITPAAKALLAAARTAVPAGVYRWGDFEIAVDTARRVGWRRTTTAHLGETASYDGSTFTRRYAELGLEVSRLLAEDDVAFAFAYLPIWIAEPAHYARWFEVTAETTRQVKLVRNARTAYTLAFDDQQHLVAVRDGQGHALVEVTWTQGAPSRVLLGGESIDVGFTAQPLADAVAWAHGTSAPGITVSLPGHLVAYWRDAVTKLSAGSAQWRHAQRQLLAALAATHRADLQLPVLEALRGNGGVELGDLVLASGGLARAPAAQRQLLLAGIASTPAGAYLAAARGPATVTTGFIGSLWQLREALGLAQARKWTEAVNRLVAIDGRASVLRLVGASAFTTYHGVPPIEAARAWDAAAVGEYKNLARAAAALAYAARGDHETATERLLQLVMDLDLRARPPQLASFSYIVRQSRRGEAGWQLIWNTARDRVLAGTSYEHVLALVVAAVQQPTDLLLILQRASVLAVGDGARLEQVAQLGMVLGQPAFVQQLIEPALRSTPTRLLHQLASQTALTQGRTADALAQAEAAQRLADPDEQVDLQTLRAELGQLVELARRLAAETTGPVRADAMRRMTGWVQTWRELDRGNPQIDRTVGNALLSLGETSEAWRQLSTIIERDPMAGENYAMVAETFEQRGRVAEAIDLWQQALVLDQTNPTPRLRKAQALITVGRTAEGDALLADIANRTWHVRWDGVVWQVKSMRERAGQRP